MKTKLKNLKEDVKFNQFNMINKILSEIDFVKNNTLGLDINNNFNEKNSFEGALGTNVYFVGNDTLAVGDSGLFKRTEIELRKYSNEVDKDYQSLCHIYKTASLDNYMCRRRTASKDILVTIVTPECLKQNQNTKNTAFKAKHGMLSIKHTAQENVNKFVKDLYNTVNYSIKNAATERENNVNGSNKILDFVTDHGKGL